MSYEQSPDAIDHIDPNLIRLPDNLDAVTLKKLESKAQEYADRVTRYDAEGADKKSTKYIDSMYKMLIMQSLLRDKSVKIEDIRDQVMSDLGEVNEYRLDSAFNVIQDYVLSGGANTHGGTGL